MQARHASVFVLLCTRRDLVHSGRLLQCPVCRVDRVCVCVCGPRPMPRAPSLCTRRPGPPQVELEFTIGENAHLENTLVALVPSTSPPAGTTPHLPPYGLLQRQRPQDPLRAPRPQGRGAPCPRGGAAQHHPQLLRGCAQGPGVAGALWCCAVSPRPLPPPPPPAPRHSSLSSSSPEASSSARNPWCCSRLRGD